MHSLSSCDEKELLHRIRNSDSEAFQEIYNRYAPKLLMFVKKYVKVPQYSEDIVQDAFTKLWEIRESIQPEKYFRGYLFTITKNLVFKFLKTATFTNEVMDDIIISFQPDDTDIQQSTEWKELKSEIQKAILLLSPRRKEIFLLCKEESLSYDQISTKLNISRNTIKEHMVLAMKFIREYLKSRSALLLSALSIMICSV